EGHAQVFDVLESRALGDRGERQVGFREQLMAGNRTSSSARPATLSAKPEASSVPISPARGATAWIYFIENIVDPNAVVGIDFQLNVITRRDGSVVSGMVERETETGYVVRTVTETVTVPKSEVVDRQILEQSMMPPGLLASLSERETIELLMFLATER
ncbi:MAG: hypothetical protein ACREIA_25135, partial [Opitutaceae bacterium]